MERVLITGAAGFLGSHLCDRFLKEGFHVIGVDNFITGAQKNISHLFFSKTPLPNGEGMFAQANFRLSDEFVLWRTSFGEGVGVRGAFQFIEHDVTKPLFIEDDVKYILHFASPASPIDYLKIPIQTLKVSSLGTHNMLGLAKAKKARILVASTSEVYGDPLMHPQKEEYWGNVNPIGPRGVYDEAKRFMEALTMAYHTYHGLETRIARIFNTYGPRMRLNDGRVLPAFIGQALRGEDLTVFGDGSQTRSFCYVDDLVEGIYRLLMSDYVYPVNLGNPDEITIKQFAEEILKLTGAKQKIIYKPLPQDDPKQRKPDISLAKKILGWEPKVSRSEGLKITYEYFKSISKEELNTK
jgi:dTDP-glucose 4,6-dehydratase